MPNSFWNALVVWLSLLFVVVIMWIPFKKMLKGIKEIYREIRGIKIK